MAAGSNGIMNSRRSHPKVKGLTESEEFDLMCDGYEYWITDENDRFIRATMTRDQAQHFLDYKLDPGHKLYEVLRHEFIKTNNDE